MKRGIVTVAGWTLGPDGEEYRYFWCADWRIVTDKQMPVDGFRSSEKWQLWGYGKNSELAIVIPGCQVKGFVVSEMPSGSKKCLVVE